jgi:hypothetical protein
MNLYYGPIIIVDQIGLDIYVNQILLSVAEFLSYGISFFFI